MVGRSWGALLGCTALTLTFVAGAVAVASAAEASMPLANPYAGNSQVLPEGKSLYNQYCSHCHGPDAIQGERPRDLRRLKIRYGDKAVAVFYTTFNDGRMEKGMPVWRDVLSEDVMWKIYTFLSSVQTQP